MRTLPFLLHSPKSAQHLNKAEIVWLKCKAASEKGLKEFLLEAIKPRLWGYEMPGLWETFVCLIVLHASFRFSSLPIEAPPEAPPENAYCIHRMIQIGRDLCWSSITASAPTSALLKLKQVAHSHVQTRTSLTSLMMEISPSPLASCSTAKTVSLWNFFSSIRTVISL